MKRAKKHSGALHGQSFAPRENIPLFIVHNRFGYLVLRKAKTAGPGRMIGWYGLPRITHGS